MLRQYIQAALAKAQYRQLEDGFFFGDISGLDGVYAHEEALEDCKRELESALGDWILFRAQQGLVIPVLDGLDLNFKESA